ncbi:MBL fold metallo-hydrolase [Amycolatopsis benzoatilytica]|uniref:MBL fold metallo-hydrolase n=1 Tax=Amycolatopsis benzoatilytica TaxID=346045 RepID=UPI0003651D05|nr:MBL fold metallo-hydrolase [Amycolatopsis benzoatilytica]
MSISDDQARPSDEPAFTRRRLGRYAAAAAAGVGAYAFMPGGVANAESATTAQHYYDQAKRLAGDDPVLLDIIGSLGGRNTPPRQYPPGPMMVFDNLAVFGVGEPISVEARAVFTSAGIVLIDSLNSPADVQNVIAPGLRALGADPAAIRYVVVTHGHFDHFGGAQYLADTYGARVLMSPADWAYMAGTTQSDQPRHDLDISNGQRLTLGDTTLTLHYTPGHTPGTVSPIFPVRYKGKHHTAMLWGGTKVPSDLASQRTYLSSIETFRLRMQQAGVDVELNNHPFCDYGLERMQQLADDPGAGDPFILGAGGTERFMKVMEYMLRGRIADTESASPTAASTAHNHQSCC